MLGVSIQTRAGSRASAVGERGIVAHVDEIGRQPPLVLEAADQPEGAAIAIVRGDDMRAGGQEQQERAAPPPVRYW